MRLDLANGIGAFRRDRDDPRCRVIGIAPHFLLHQGLTDDALLVFSGGGIPLPCRRNFQQCRGFAMQPVGTPIGRQIAAMPPDRPLLHTADGLPDILAPVDVRPGEQHLATAGLHSRR